MLRVLLSLFRPLWKAKKETCYNQWRSHHDLLFISRPLEAKFVLSRSCLNLVCAAWSILQTAVAQWTPMPSNSSSPPVKKARFSLLAIYEETSVAVVQAPFLRCVLQAYLKSAFASRNPVWTPFFGNHQFKPCANLWAACMVFQRCLPQWSAIFMCLHRTHMSANILCDLVFAECNSHLLAW